MKMLQNAVVVVVVGIIVRKRFESRDAIVVGFIFGDSFQRGNAVVVCFIFFAVVCLYLVVNDAACWWLEVFLCKVDFVVFNTFAVSFVVRFRTVGFFRFTSVVVAVVVIDMMVLILLSMLAFLVSRIVSALSVSVLSISVLLTLSVV